MTPGELRALRIRETIGAAIGVIALYALFGLIFLFIYAFGG